MNGGNWRGNGDWEGDEGRVDKVMEQGSEEVKEREGEGRMGEGRMGEERNSERAREREGEGRKGEGRMGERRMGERREVKGEGIFRDSGTNGYWEAEI